MRPSGRMGGVCDSDVWMYDNSAGDSEVNVTGAMIL